jgi:transcriptional regulator with XRE-family HTH domain
MPHIGLQKRILREKANIGIRPLAREMGITAPYLIDLERGYRRFNDELQARHADAITRLSADNKPSAGLPVAK